MKVETYFCDRCKRETTHYAYYFIQFPDHGKNHMIDRYLCGGCRTELEGWFK